MGVATKQYRATSDFTTTSTTYVDVTSATITLDNNSGGKAFISVSSHGRSSDATGKFIWLQLQDDTVSVGTSLVYYNGANAYLQQQVSYIMDDNGSVMKLQMKVTSGTTGYWRTDSSLHAFEVY